MLATGIIHDVVTESDDDGIAADDDVTQPRDADGTTGDDEDDGTTVEDDDDGTTVDDDDDGTTVYDDDGTEADDSGIEVDEGEPTSVRKSRGRVEANRTVTLSRQ